MPKTANAVVTEPNGVNTTAKEKPDEKKKTAPKPQQILTREDKREITKAIKTEETGLMNPIEYEQSKQLARDFLASGSVPTTYTNEMQVLMAILAGKELGMSPVEALNCHYFVNGKLTIYGAARARQLKRLGYQIQYEDKDWHDDSASCKATVTKGDETYTEEVTYKDAEASGYTRSNQNNFKPGWLPGINRKKKLRYLAIDVLIDGYIPEAKGSAVGSTEIVLDAPEWDNRAKIEVTEDNISESLKRHQSEVAAKPETADEENKAE